MDVNVIRDPVFLLKIKNILPIKTNKKIIEEAITNKEWFIQATIGSGINLKIRNNKAIYYDEVYKTNRKDSILLESIDGIFKNEKIREILTSSPYPFNDFGMTNYHETQVSRYGENGQHYDWHVDRFNNKRRTITFVYYFFKEPKKWKGGDIQLTNSPVYNGETIEKCPHIINIKPENNMLLIFDSNTAHRVLNTSSTSVFGDGRFSANIWIGFDDIQR